MPEVPVDERGIPTEMDATGTAAAHCPAKPCDLCVGDSNVLRSGMRVSSWEWCKQLDTCAATVDWDEIAERSRS